ncbi:hypothetical protein HCA69_02435 [Listeria grandensis]|uniref:Uncharacterized protein n=1 Tax=Listeria grandensis TaxID=1494963 RepID=A0A7X0Y1C2_9LIST|nr:hypothetical protein [Listeria grandensis]MBC1935206.1 hypothetical protein [Listeria grandensis]
MKRKFKAGDVIQYEGYVGMVFDIRHEIVGIKYTDGVEGTVAFLEKDELGDIKLLIPVEDVLKKRAK